MKTIILLCLIATTVICQDFSSQTYQSQDRSAKIGQLWRQITSNTASGEYPSGVKAAGLFTADMNVSINNFSDIMPEGRTKFIHSVGTVVKAQFIPEPNNGLSGFFQGADSLLIRFSLAKKPDYTNTSADAAYDNFAPGMALKFLVNGKPSVNLVAMFGVNGVKSYNFFDQDMNTHITRPEGVGLTLVAEKFSTATKVVQYVGLKRFSETNQDGTENKNAKFPFELTFRAPKNVKSMFTNDFTVDYKRTFSTIPSGTTILEVYATEDPNTGCKKKVGTIKTTSTFTTSIFGDENLFFQHQDFNLDLNVRSEWNIFTPFWRLIGNKDAQKPVGKCPFANIFN